jgi:hypothetical protein
MRPIDDSTFLTPDERLSEVAGIFAAGILRLRARTALLADDTAPEILPESWPTCLEVPEKTLLSVHIQTAGLQPLRITSCETIRHR